MFKNWVEFLRHVDVSITTLRGRRFASIHEVVPSRVTVWERRYRVDRGVPLQCQEAVFKNWVAVLRHVDVTITTLRGRRFASIHEVVPSRVTVWERRYRVDRGVSTTATVLAWHQRVVEPHRGRVSVVCDDFWVHRRPAVGGERVHDRRLTAALAETEPRDEYAVDDRIKTDVRVA